MITDSVVITLNADQTLTDNHLDALFDPGRALPSFKYGSSHDSFEVFVLDPPAVPLPAGAWAGLALLAGIAGIRLARRRRVV